MKAPKHEVVRRIGEIIQDLCDERDRFTINDISEAIYEGVFTEYEKELLVTFTVSKKVYEEKLI